MAFVFSLLSYQKMSYDWSHSTTYLHCSSYSIPYLPYSKPTKAPTYFLQAPAFINSGNITNPIGAMASVTASYCTARTYCLGFTLPCCKHRSKRAGFEMTLSSCERVIVGARSIGSKRFGSKEALKVAASSLMEAVRMIENFNNK